MPRAERARSRMVAVAVGAALVVLAALPGYLALDPKWRPWAVRAVCAVLVIAGCRRVIGGMRRALAEEPLSALDTAPRAPRAATVDERFVRARDDLVIGSRNRRYFDTFLAPRLRRSGGDDLPLPPPRGRRGPPMSALERVIATIEGAR
jgi:hypothetical protein